MKVAMFSWETLPGQAVGGVAAHVTELAAALERRGHEMHVFTRPGEGAVGVRRIDGVWYHFCPHALRRNLVEEVQEMCRSFVWHFFQSEDYAGRYDLVHAHDWLAASALIWIKRGRPDHPAVLTMHSTEYGRCGNNFWPGACQGIRDHEWQATACADRVIAVSQALKEEIRWIYRVPEEKCWMIHNGVSVWKYDGFIDPARVKARYGIGPMDPTVLFTGRLVLQKGADLLLEAVPGLLRYYPDAKFVFAGEGHMRGDLERRAGQLGVARAARFLGHRDGPELADLYKACDSVCVPSRNEPFGLIILEAWSAGKPVVASGIGGPRELIWPEVTGKLIEPTPDSIGWGLGTLFTDFERARWMGANGRRAAEKDFSWDTIARLTEKCYLSAASTG